jgi:hypothetical protein
MRAPDPVEHPGSDELHQIGAFVNVDEEPGIVGDPAPTC